MAYENIVAIIPARGGSKGINKKNQVNFAGEPLIKWTISQAKKSNQILNVYVSSDDQEILDISQNAGAIPLRRPEEISGDYSSSEECLNHFINSIEIIPDIVVFLQPTSPLRETKDIDLAIDVFKQSNLDSLFSATNAGDHFIWSTTEGGLRSENYDYKNRKRRQDICGQIIENGSFYIFKPKILLKNNNRLGGNIGFFLMDEWKVYEIDNMDDLKMCEFLFINKGLNKNV